MRYMRLDGVIDGTNVTTMNRKTYQNYGKYDERDATNYYESVIAPYYKVLLELLLEGEVTASSYRKATRAVGLPDKTLGSIIDSAPDCIAVYDTPTGYDCLNKGRVLECLKKFKTGYSIPESVRERLIKQKQRENARGREGLKKLKEQKR